MCGDGGTVMGVNLGEEEIHSLERRGKGKRGEGEICDPPTCLEYVKGSILI